MNAKKMINCFLITVMMAVTLFCNVPFAYASEVTEDMAYDFKCIDGSNPKYYYTYEFPCPADTQRVTFYNPDYASIVVAYISKLSWNRVGTEKRYLPKYNSEESELSKSSVQPLCDFEFEYNGEQYYIGYYERDYPQPTDGKAYYTYEGNLGTLYRCTDSGYKVSKNAKGLISDYISGDLDKSEMFNKIEGASSTESADKWGTDECPVPDSDIGYLNVSVTNRNIREVNSVEDITNLDTYHYNVDWENKTDTGFSLTSNKYTQSFIQMEVESKFVWTKDRSHKEISDKFKNYGEVGWISKGIDPTAKPYSFTGDKWTKALPNSIQELMDNAQFHSYISISGDGILFRPDFTVRMRVVCSNSSAVIPTDFVCGPWVSFDLSADENNDDDVTTIRHEGFNDDKNFNGDSYDVTHTDTNYDDNQDAKDNIHNSPNNSSDLTIDNAIGFIKQLTRVPELIKTMFSFFPDWVLSPYMIGFALIPVLIIYKLIKG